MKLTAQVDRGYSVAGSSLVRDGMARHEQSCELCNKAPRRSTDTLLCLDCAKAVSQVMPCELYEANHDLDRRAQLAQMRLLVKAATRGE